MPLELFMLHLLASASTAQIATHGSVLRCPSHFYGQRDDRVKGWQTKFSLWDKGPAESSPFRGILLSELGHKRAPQGFGAPGMNVKPYEYRDNPPIPTGEMGLSILQTSTY